MMDWRKTSALQPHESWTFRGEDCDGPVYWRHDLKQRRCETCGCVDPVRPRRTYQRRAAP